MPRSSILLSAAAPLLAIRNNTEDLIRATFDEARRG